MAAGNRVRGCRRVYACEFRALYLQIWRPDCAACRWCRDLIKAFDWIGHVVAFYSYSHPFTKCFDLGHSVFGHLLVIARFIRDVRLGIHIASRLTKYGHHRIGLRVLAFFFRFASLFLSFFWFVGLCCFERLRWCSAFGRGGWFGFRVTTKKIQRANGSPNSCNLTKQKDRIGLQLAHVQTQTSKPPI